MKYLLLSLFLLTSGTKAPSQKVQFYTGAKIEDNDNGSFYLFSQDSFYLYAFRSSEQNYFLEMYKKETLERSAIIKIPLPSKDTIKYDIENLFIRKDTFQIFYSYFDKTSSSKKLEMTVFDGRGSKLGETKLIDKSEGQSKRKSGDFSVINRRKFNEFLSYGYKNGKDTSYINIDHFDYSGNMTRSQYFSLYNNSGFVVHSAIDEDCNLYHLTRNKWGNRNVQWSIKFYSPEASEAQIIALKQPSAEKIYLSNFFETYVDSQQQFNILSPYTLTPLSKNATGVYLARIDFKTHALISESVIPFRLNKETSAYEGDFSLASCIIKTIIPMSDKRLKIVFESRLETTNSMYGVTVAKEYDIGNIITVDLDSNNVVTEIHHIKKQQHTNAGGVMFTGFAILSHGDKSYFIYNELPGNLLRSPDMMKKVNSSKMDETAVIYTAVNDSKVTRNVLINKTPGSGVDAVLPNRYISSFYKNEIYLLRKIRADVYLTRIFIND